MNHIVVTSTPDDELTARWNAFLQGSRLATHYVTPNYFIDPYVRGDRFAILAIDAAGEIAAVLTGVRSDERIVSGTFSRPQVLLRTRTNRGKAVAALAAGLRHFSSGSALTEIYTWEPLEFNCHGMRARRSGDDTSIAMLDLAKGSGSIFAGFSQTQRDEIRKADEQDRVEIKEPDTVDELEELHRIHCEWNKRMGQTPGTFQQVLMAFAQRENHRVFIAKADGKIAAGAFIRFCRGGIVEFAANFSVPEYQRFRPNNLLGWHAIKWACENGFSHFSLGAPQPFLRRFGGELMTTFRYRRDPSLFRLNDLRENAFDISVGALELLPDSLRTGVRRMLTK